MTAPSTNSPLDLPTAVPTAINPSAEPNVLPANSEQPADTAGMAPAALTPAPLEAPPGQEGVDRISSLLQSLEEVALESGHHAATSLSAPPNPHELQLVRARLGIASALYVSLRCKNPAAAAHSLRVALGCSAWAATLGMPDKLRTQLEIAALLHDVGKIGVPDHVLLKPGRLLPEEIGMIDRHLDMAGQILLSAGVPEAIVHQVVSASAWYDGSHRLVQLSGDEIPVASRMLAIVDAFDSMTTDHVYRPAKSRERAISELFEFAGRQFDPALVKSYAEHFNHNQRQLQDEVATRWVATLEATQGLPWKLDTNSPRPVHAASPQTNMASGASIFETKLIDNMHDGVLFVDTQRQITQWNTGAERMTGVSGNAAVGKLLTPSLLEMCERSGRMIDDEDCPVKQAISTGVQSIQRLAVLGRNGSQVDVDLHVIPVQSDDGAAHGATILLHDASSETSLEEKCNLLHVEMTKDPLTQVANRAEFDRMLAAFIDAHQETGLPCSLIMADIDHFKQINDTYGHQAGDQAIISFASLLKSMCRSGDLVARYGGEEFAVLCADCNNASAAARAEQIRKKLAETMHTELGNNGITASFGVTQLQSGDVPETMLRRSDRALLQAKDQGRNQVVQLGDGMIEETPKQSWWPFASWSSKSLLQSTLVTNTPIEVAVQKLRGFIADHDAKIVKITDNEVRLEANDKSTGKLKREGDRAVAFLIDIQLSQEHIERTNSAGFASGSYVQTTLEVTLRPRRDRDRRKSQAMDRARMLIGSLKSYLMAKEQTAELAGK